ncbi:TraR/DksA C4-type zinc finger protein [Streptomyces sp. NPDC059787]|uniref:TraR/DksA family transcriptional regulator n=1 Tax=Streptomyces sp. NPDC059787 TaxID=3346947 RepID=UPI003664AB3A
MVAKKTAVQQPAPSGAAPGGGAERAGGTAGAAAAAKAPTRTTTAKKATGRVTGAPARKTAGKTTARTAHDGEPVASKPSAGTPRKKAATRKAPTKKATARKPAVEEAPAGKATVKKPPVDGASAGKATARKPAVEGASAGEAGAKEEAVEGASVGKAAVKKPAGAKKPAGVKKAAAKKVAAEAVVPGGGAVGKKGSGKGAVREAASAGSREAGLPGSGAGGPVQDVAGHSTADDADAVDAAAQTGVTTVGAKKTPGTATAAKSPVPKARIGAAEPGDLAVRPGEEPWTPEEAEEARAELTSEVLRLREEITSSEQSLAGLMRDSGDGAGDDDADTGTKNITREHELALAANAREMLTQFERALQRLDAGTYGLCENCGDPIGKARMQAFPRATLCVECKQKQERRY